MTYTGKENEASGTNTRRRLKEQEKGYKKRRKLKKEGCSR